jgi:hypothetical protein
LPKEPLAKLFLCHPERSEGSQPSEDTGFFAPLRMTMVVIRRFARASKVFSVMGCLIIPLCERGI